MKVLIACEESQTECIAFRDKGHEAYSCDIVECSGGHPEWHIQCDAMKVLTGFCKFKTQDGSKHTIDGKWDLVIAHPPCTYLSNVGAKHLFPNGEIDYQRYSQGLAAKEFFMRFYLYGKYGYGKICIENPTPSSVYDLPLPTQSVEPYYFGHPYSKKTWLWEFGIPKLKPTKMISQHTPFLESVSKDSRARSKAFKGMAEAMSNQWGKDDLNAESDSG